MRRSLLAGVLFAVLAVQPASGAQAATANRFTVKDSYRFSTKGRESIVARGPSLDQWGFMARSCVTDWRGVTFNNEDD